MTDNDAIREDVSAEETALLDAGATTGEEQHQEEGHTPRVTPHSQAMEDIAKRLYGEDDAGDPGEPEPPRDERGRFAAAPAAEQTVKVKVDGVETDLPISEVVKGYQKDATASRRLEEAANLRKQLENEWAALQAEKARQTQAAPPQAPQDAGPSEDDASAAKRIYDSLMLGDEAEGVKALSELLQGRSQQAIPVEEVASQAAERARYQIEYGLAEKKFKDDFQDITKDPDLNQVAMTFLQQTVQTSTTYDEAFAKAGQATRDWMRQKAEALGYTFTPPKQDATSSRIERKQQLDNPRPASARTPRPQEEREPTPSEIIAQMRRGRGLPA